MSNTVELTNLNSLINEIKILTGSINILDKAVESKDSGYPSCVESLALLVTIMILISILGAPIGFLILKIPTRKQSTTMFKKLMSFMFTLIGFMLGTTILLTGPAFGGVLIALFSIGAAIFVFIKIWLDKSSWEH